MANDSQPSIRVIPMPSAKKPQILLDGDITAAVDEAGQASVPKVLLDMSSVKFFGSSYIEVLYRLWKQMESRKGRFVISGLHPYCREVLQVTNLDKIWTIVTDRDAGLTILREFTSKS
jgi:anti-anti-sigma factor